MSLFKQKPKTEREKVEERREEVLAHGRKFKYPLQYAKHRLMINTVIVALVALILMVVAGWAMLFKFQDTGDMIYRVTQVLPIPVAEVEGTKVRYSDYLMIYRSNLITAEQQGGQLGTGEDADNVRQLYKQAALYSAVEYTYALKLGHELNLTVSDEEVDKAFDEHRKVGGVERSEEGFLKILRDNFGMNKSEYRRMLYLTLMRSKVAQAVDDPAREQAKEVERILQESDGDLHKAADEVGAKYEETGRSTMAMTLEPGQISQRFLSSNGDAYYFVKLNDKTNSEVNYASLEITFSKFEEMIAELYASDNVKLYIDVNPETEESGE